ncbi:prepilin-type N-terminal cleavage/methylation domain-containing protein [Cerasicoccus frondis]|uniref:prepilin-type N-terminal cleavage/methylation domain-containing protein n=1 Tax=Cerasicoccus frondis TaxID=490090 RepID=UPI002852B684|nr:prepilin-type N-terminal cleavage/methylation domain-containing protein [Cerasicoccus frondis]
MASTTTTTARSNKTKGFSLIEMLIVTTVLGFFVMIATSSMLSLSRSSSSLINYQAMNEESRLMLEQFARDLRSATQVINATDTELEIVTRTSSGGAQTVTYTYNANASVLYRQVGVGVREIILSDVSAFDLDFYTFRGNTTNTPIETKRVQIEAMMERSVLSTKNTNHIISAQFVLRNHRVNS